MTINEVVQKLPIKAPNTNPQLFLNPIFCPSVMHIILFGPGVYAAVMVSNRNVSNGNVIVNILKIKSKYEILDC